MKTMSITDISTWFATHIGNAVKARTCQIKLEKGPLGNAVFLICGANTSVFADSPNGCQFLLREQKDSIENELLEQYGYDSDETSPG